MPTGLFAAQYYLMIWVNIAVLTFREMVRMGTRLASDLTTAPCPTGLSRERSSQGSGRGPSPAKSWRIGARPNRRNPSLSSSSLRPWSTSSPARTWSPWTSTPPTSPLGFFLSMSDTARYNNYFNLGYKNYFEGVLIIVQKWPLQTCKGSCKFWID